MASHADIITRNGGDEKVASALGVNWYQARDWRRRNSIPADRWKALAEADMASLEELAEGAAAKAANPPAAA